MANKNRKKEQIGIVTMQDIIEEIVGNIEDDFEKYKKMS